MENRQAFLFISIIFAFLIALGCLLNPIKAQDTLPEIPRNGRIEDTLRESILEELTLYIHPDTSQRVYAASCRTAYFGCENRISYFAQYIVEAAQEYGVDPWLLAGIAWHESRFYPFAVGGVGEKGIMQLHPRSHTSNGVRFVRNRWYWQSCRRVEGECQREVVQAAAREIANAIELCGNIPRALTAYNTGRCDVRNRYARKVLVARRRLLQQ